MKIKKIAVALICAAFTAVLCGCMTQSVDDLYSLPELSEGYLRLQKKINEELATGTQYAAPASGTHRQSVQFEDIDLDGHDEALVFLSSPGSDKPLKICIFKYLEDDYVKVTTLEGEGSNVDSIDYVDMDGDGTKEIIVGWQIASGMNLMTVYTMKNFNAISVLSTGYTEYMVKDLTGDLHSDIVVLRVSNSDMTGEAEAYSLLTDGEVTSTKARLTNGIEAIARVRNSKLYSGEEAVFVESTVSGGGIVTDILICADNSLTNITMDETSGISTDTIRIYGVYSRDINGDSSLDVPCPVALPTQTDSSTYYVIEWYGYKANGSRQKVMHTYVNYSDSWYMIVPGDWMENFTVRREDSQSGERVIVFSEVLSMEDSGDGQEKVVEALDILKIYVFTGDNRREKATIGNRFILKDEEEKLYAAEILPGAEESSLTISESLVKNNFNLLYSEWITGET